jgi:hypothetical protein
MPGFVITTPFQPAENGVLDDLLRRFPSFEQPSNP